MSRGGGCGWGITFRGSRGHTVAYEPAATPILEPTMCRVLLSSVVVTDPASPEAVGTVRITPATRADLRRVEEPLHHRRDAEQQHPLRDPAEQRRQTHRTVGAQLVRTLARLKQRDHGAVPPCALCVVKDANDSGASPSRSVQKVVNPFGGHLIGKSDCTTLHSKDGFYRFTYRLPVHATHGGNYCGGLVWLSQTKRRPPGATSFDAHGMFSPQPHIKTSGGIHMASAATNIRDDVQLLQKYMRALQSLA